MPVNLRPTNSKPLYLIDAIGPFFRGLKRKTINWSKIPFDHLGIDDSTGTHQQWAQIQTDLEIFATKTTALGFNAVSLDDVSHLADHPTYETAVRSAIARYREEFRRCFAILERHGLSVYLTMDYLSLPLGIKRERVEPLRFVRELLSQFLDDFPDVAGVILRIGEADGHDVRGLFRSELHITSATEANTLLKVLLPVFEARQRRLIFRTWTVGAYPIGDLIWHRNTFARALLGIDSPALIVSMKHGESDFFRFLPLNGNFFGTKLPKIIEFQTRREYEGCGEFPAFVGEEYRRLILQLQAAENVVGCMIWCQTGGWVPFRRLAFVDGTGIWAELNTAVVIAQFQAPELDLHSTVLAVARRLGCPNPESLWELLQLSESAVRRLMYVEQAAQQKLFFRRVRLPTLFHVYWHNLFVNEAVRSLLRLLVQDREESLNAARDIMGSFGRMEELARQCEMPENDIAFMEDTFQLLALSRQYVFSDDTKALEQELRHAKRNYKEKYPKGGARHRYRIKLDFAPLRFHPRYLRWAVLVFFRRVRGYRVLDHLVTLRLLSYVYRLISRHRPEWVPEFARKSAMGLETVFK
ncbi:MAG: hypothetical protein JNJ83_21305 [Verrucomicrobiaceae bacterium]|nr:hypothetical protein [Verrucomicrobiaceae bacterium]